MELAMLIISNDQTLRSNTVQDMKEKLKRRTISFYEASY